MIADPLKIRSHDFFSKKLLSWLKNHPGELCFFDHHRRSGERWIGVVDSDQTELWWIDVPQREFSITGDCVGHINEKFFEFLRAKYPDHLEWFLFHPELFNG